MFFIQPVTWTFGGGRGGAYLDLHDHRLIGIVVKASALRAEDCGFESHLRRGLFWGRVIPVTSKLALQYSGYPARCLAL